MRPDFVKTGFPTNVKIRSVYPRRTRAFHGELGEPAWSSAAVESERKMSWLFGIKKDQPGGGEMPDLSSLGVTVPPGGGAPAGGGSGGGDDGKKSSRMEGYHFDSSALERAAKAARDLEASRE